MKQFVETLSQEFIDNPALVTIAVALIGGLFTALGWLATRLVEAGMAIFRRWVAKREAITHRFVDAIVRYYNLRTIFSEAARDKYIERQKNAEPDFRPYIANHDVIDVEA